MVDLLCISDAEATRALRFYKWDLGKLQVSAASCFAYHCCFATSCCWIGLVLRFYKWDLGKLQVRWVVQAWLETCSCAWSVQLLRPCAALLQGGDLGKLQVWCCFTFLCGFL